jgi:hypothetical protein
MSGLLTSVFRCFFNFHYNIKFVRKTFWGRRKESFCNRLKSEHFARKNFSLSQYFIDYNPDAFSKGEIEVVGPSGVTYAAVNPPSTEKSVPVM